MGTNYYARIKPSDKDKQKLISLIEDGQDYYGIIELTKALYAEVNDDYYPFEGGIVHLGKSSYGWKFLWNTNWREYDGGHWDGESGKWIKDIKLHKFYDLTAKSLYDFIMREDITIYDEYGEMQDKEKFWKFATETKADGLTSASYNKDSKSVYKKFSDKFYHDFIEVDPYHDKWVKLGCKKRSDKSYHDFIKDGLRWSTSTWFS